MAKRLNDLLKYLQVTWAREEGRYLLMLLGVLLLRLVLLGAFPLIDPSEGRYGEIARQMATNGDWIVPRFNDAEPFWGKPPLYFWLASLCIYVFGASAWAVRLPSFIFHVGTLAMIYWGTAAYFSRLVRARAVLILSTMGLFYVLSGLALVDSAFCFAVTLSCVGLLLPKSHWRIYVYALGLSLALLAKGLLALIVLGPVALVWAVFFPFKNYGMFARIGVLAGASFLGVLIAVPWHLLAELRTPGFLSYYLLGEHYARFTQPGWVSMYGTAHVEPYGSIWLYLGGALFPWVLFLPRFVTRYKQKSDSSSPVLIFIYAWAALLPVLFTFSHGTMFSYVLPNLPAWGLIISLLIEKGVRPSAVRVCKFASVVPVGFALTCLVILPFVGIRRSESWITDKRDVIGLHEGDRITYVGKIPYTAEFYSKGEAQLLSELTQEEITKRTDDGVEDFYVTEKNNAATLNLLKGSLFLKEVLKTSKRHVFKESAAPRALQTKYVPEGIRTPVFNVKG